MPETEEELILSPAFLAGKLDALEAILLAACSELPPRAMHHIRSEAAELRNEAERNRERNDIWRDRAAGIWGVANRFDETLAMRSDEIDEGARIRTVQPAPIDKVDQAYPKKGW
jgi:hypothetical protein